MKQVILAFFLVTAAIALDTIPFVTPLQPQEIYEGGQLDGIQGRVRGYNEYTGGIRSEWPLEDTDGGLGGPYVIGGHNSGIYGGLLPWYDKGSISGPVNSAPGHLVSINRPAGPQVLNGPRFDDHHIVRDWQDISENSQSSNCLCLPIIRPVCASDFKTYVNECVMMLCSDYRPCELTKLHNGPCGYLPTPQGIGSLRVSPFDDLNRHGYLEHHDRFGHHNHRSLYKL